MASPFTLFEISWEVCNKVGGIYTVLSSKAKTVVERFGDGYIAIGPWLLSDSERDVPFRDEPGHEAYGEACRRMGLPVRVGRWKIPGSPLTILVEFSELYGRKDGILSGLWEDYGVDSLSGEWDYVEPVLFGHAAGKIIEEWWDRYLAPGHRRGVVHAHEWMTSSALLYLKKNVPSLGTVFTTHATMLGRALSSLGHSPDDGLGALTADELAEEHNVVAKHSLEGTSAREADVFTTVSEITASEAELLHRRAPRPVTPNGIDLDVIDAVAGASGRDEVRAELTLAASQFLGENVGDAALLCISGRYEFHNKGMDLLLDALARLNGRAGRRVILWVLVPAGNSGVRSEFTERRQHPAEHADGPLGISTHNLFDEDDDPTLEYCRKVGLTNAPESRVKVIHVPVYLHAKDDFLQKPYEAVLRAMDLSCFPSYYEPWGYTPQESIAVGVPTITSDYAGFGRWALGRKVAVDDGITVLKRVHVEYSAAAAELDATLEAFLGNADDAPKRARRCRATARLTAWSDFFAHYEEAYAGALSSVQARLEQGVLQRRRPKHALPVQPVPDGRRPRMLTFDVSATLPAPLAPLQRLSRNFWWCWDPEAPDLFRQLSPIAWEACGHNPVLLLQRAYPEDIADRAADKAYIAMLERVVQRFDDYLNEEPNKGRWRELPGGGADSGLSAEHPVAYFCAEFGIHESLKIYSGGLGILAGDHLKSASDLNLPLVGVGLFYRKGYLLQRVSSSGEQIALDADNDPRNLPLELARDTNGDPIEIGIHLPGRELALRAWHVRVGRVSLYLLDSDTPSNRAEDRDITRNLYGGEHETRLQQEIVLGRGGARLLRRLGIRPAAYHMNEGHAAFLTLDRVGNRVRQGDTFEEAREIVCATTLFTTHTPVPAGHDRFGEDLMRRYFSDVADWLGVPWERFYALGQAPDQPGEFNMTYLALNFVSYCNGVSQLHGQASRKLLHPFFPGLVEDEVPVASITNGIHLPTWTHPAIAAAMGVEKRTVLGADFAKRPTAETVMAVWRAKQEVKAELIERVGVTLRRSFLERHDSPLLLDQVLDGLRDDALLLGFARRFAPYKRAHLLFQDPERLRALLEDEERPLRVFVAGKAHPKDDLGKDILRSIAEIARNDDFAGKVFFIENYDISLARVLVQGVDVWLNNPTRMLEASGTSGMKVSANGGLNLSIGDGWWPEGFDGDNGWMIADGRVYEDQTLQDEFDGSALYRLLEEELVPEYFDRDRKGIPTRWLARVRKNLKTIPPVFNTDRMVADYLAQAYGVLGRASVRLTQDRAAVRHTVREQQRIRRGFGELAIVAAEVTDLGDLRVGDRVDVRVEVALGPLVPEDVTVELVLGHTDDDGRLQGHQKLVLQHVGGTPAGTTTHTFEGSQSMERSGSYAYGLRVRPRTQREGIDPLHDLVLWA